MNTDRNHKNPLHRLLSEAAQHDAIPSLALHEILAQPDALDRQLGRILGSLGQIPIEADGPDPSFGVHKVDSEAAPSPYLDAESEVALSKAIEFTRRRLEWTASISDCDEPTRERYLDRIERTTLPTIADQNRLIAVGEAEVRARLHEHLMFRNQLVEANLALVDRIAFRYRTYGIPHGDLAQHGNLGLIRAADKFDWRKNVRFRTYAEWWIRQAIERATDTDRDVIHVPRPMRQKISKANRLHRAMGGTQPLDPRRFAELMDIEPTAAARVLSIKSGIASLERAGLEEGSPIKNDLEGPDLGRRSESEQMEHLRARIGGMMGELPEREQRVLFLRYGLKGEDPRTLEEVGAILEISRERVRQLQMRALDHLRIASADPRVQSDS